MFVVLITAGNEKNNDAGGGKTLQREGDKCDRSSLNVFYKTFCVHKTNPNICLFGFNQSHCKMLTLRIREIKPE